MRIPIIKVNGRIVGTNSHDCLYINHNTIHFFDIQCCGSSEEYPDDYKFEGKTDEHNFTGYPEIEFVSLEKLVELAIQQCRENFEYKKKLRELIQRYIDEEDKCRKTLNDTGIFTTDGTLL